MALMSSPDFWVALFQIILINIVLSGDNAVVIALACRSLPPKQQKNAILFGSFGAILLRVVLTFFAVYLLTLPYLKLIGAVLLLWIGVGLLKGEDEEEDLGDNAGLWAAVKTIIIADLVMSLDNVIGVAAAAKGSVPLLVIGLVISVPLIIFGSTLILKLMNRFPVIITLGAGLLGWVAGEMTLTDPAIHDFIEKHHYLHNILPALGAVIVVALGKYLASRGAAQQEHAADQPAA